MGPIRITVLRSYAPIVGLVMKKGTNALRMSERLSDKILLEIATDPAREGICMSEEARYMAKEVLRLRKRVRKMSGELNDLREFEEMVIVE